jgi:transposase
MKNKPSAAPALVIGIDWADQKHDVCAIDASGKEVSQQIDHTPEAIDAWVSQQLEQADGHPIAIILEQSRGALIHALMFRENVMLYPINPKQLANYRESYSNAGSKNDARDAWLLARMLWERIRILKPWVPDDEQTRLLARFCQQRRQLVNERTRLLQQLTDQLKAYFPLALQLNPRGVQSSVVLELLRRWPDPRQLRNADRRWLVKVFKQYSIRNSDQQQALIDRIRSAKLLSSDNALIESAAIVVEVLAKQIPVLQKAIDKLDQKIEHGMATHTDAMLFQSLPGAGKALAPRLLTAFGSQRDRYASADEMSTYSGIAPVTKKSGKTRIVHRRFACPKYLRQTFHEFAAHAKRWCPWSRAYYELQRSRGMKHHAALRKLALRWIRILYVVWKNRVPYDANRYLATIQRKNPALVPFLQIQPK